MLDRAQLARLGSIQEGVESRASCFETLRAVSSAEEMFYVPCPRAEWGHWNAEGNEHPGIAGIPAR